MKNSANSWFLTWGVGIIAIGLGSIIILLWIMRREPMPVPNQPDLPTTGLFPDQVKSAELRRTDTIDQERMICLLNATTKELMTVYLQTWSITPPRTISEAPHRIWAFTEAPARDILSWVAATFQYALNEEGEEIKLMSSPEKSDTLTKHAIACPSVQVGAGKLGDRLWNAMRDHDFHFFAILPASLSNLEIPSQPLSSLLSSHKINVAKQDNSYIFWTANSN